MWEPQAKAIEQLGPAGKKAALVELAMGLGKTSMIAPALLSLFADGTQLPVLVMLESLVPSMAAELSDNIRDAFNGEVRVIPIDRITKPERSEADIDRLRRELETMKEERIALIWSAGDIQTLINSYIEHMEKRRASGTTDGEPITRAWQRLFAFLRRNANIIGDEIHAILDILTSYNFALGKREQLLADEMDAVADLLDVITNPELEENAENFVLDQVKLFGSRKGIDPPSSCRGCEICPCPFTESLFIEHVRPLIVDKLIARGITNDPAAKEYVNQLTEDDRDKIRQYLLSDSSITSKNFLGDERRRRALELPTELLPSDRKALDNHNTYPKKQAQKMAKDKILASYKKITERMRNFVAVQKESLRTVFQTTVVHQLGKHYVLNRNQDCNDDVINISGRPTRFWPPCDEGCAASTWAPTRMAAHTTQGSTHARTLTTKNCKIQLLCTSISYQNLNMNIYFNAQGRVLKVPRPPSSPARIFMNLGNPRRQRQASI